MLLNGTMCAANSVQQREFACLKLGPVKTRYRKVYYEAPSPASFLDLREAFPTTRSVGGRCVHSYRVARGHRSHRDPGQLALTVTREFQGTRPGDDVRQ